MTESREMSTAVKRFFSSSSYAVAGASNDTSKYGYKVLAWYAAHSLPATPLNPSSPVINLTYTPLSKYLPTPSSMHHINPTATLQTVALSTVASPSQLSVPDQTSLSIITPPAITRKILAEAKEAGIKAVWLQPGSFDREGLEFAKREFEAAVGGGDGGGGEGWCVLVDGERGMREAGREKKKL